jgi:6-phosphofructokinase
MSHFEYWEGTSGAITVITEGDGSADAKSESAKKHLRCRMMGRRKGWVKWHAGKVIGKRKTVTNGLGKGTSQDRRTQRRRLTMRDFVMNAPIC